MILITYQQRFSRSGRLGAKIPGPKPVFLAGNMFDLGRNPIELLNGFLQAADKYGSVVRFWVGPSLQVLISDPQNVEFFLSSTSILEKTYGYEFIRPWLGTGLISANGGPKWHAHRKMLTPAFHFKILETFVDIFNKNTNILIKKLKCEVGKPCFDIEPYVSDLALDIICESAMGTPVNAQLQDNSRFAEAIREVTITIMCRSFMPWLYPKLLFDMSHIGRAFHRNVKYILDIVDQVIIEKKKKLHEENKLKMEESEKHSDECDVRKKYAFLDLMLQYRDVNSAALSDMDVRDEVNTFMFAGQDTTKSAMSFALYRLAKHPEIQEEVVKELNAIFGGSDREETYQDLQNMKYLERVIKETLRMYTTVPIIGRRLTHEVTLPNGGYTLPKGTPVLLFLYKLHQNSEIYPNPEEFNPDRFLLENAQNRSPYAYCPFSAGPRNCIGQKFAMLELKSALSSVLRNYRLLPCESGPDVVVSAEVVLRSATGVHVCIEKRGK